MKNKKLVENIIIVVFFFIVIAYPIAFYFVNAENNLSGAEEKVELSLNTLDDYVIQNFPGREFLVRTKNQFLYKFFDVSPNNSITKLGDYLFFTETFNYYYHGLYHANEKDMDETISKLKKLNDILEKRGKHLAIITTPTKPRYYDGKLPLADDVILAHQKDLGKMSFDIFREKLNNSELNYFDFVKDIDENKDKYLNIEAPLFYKSGHHWSNCIANMIGMDFTEFLRERFNLTLPTMHMEPVKVDEPIYPDADIFQVLNVYDKPNEQFYEARVTYDTYVSSGKNFIIQGGSFIGGLLFPSITIGDTNNVIQIVNKDCTYDHYRKVTSFETYDELDKKINLLDAIKNNDIYILEIHEINVYNATFGFLDYLLSYEDIL